MGCANTRARHVSVTETSHGHRCLCLPHHQIPFWRWARDPSGGGVCVHGPLYWTAPLCWEVCVHGSPSLDSDSVHEGSLPWAQSPGLCVHLRETKHPARFLWDLSPLHIYSVNAHPQPPDMKTFLHPPSPAPPTSSHPLFSQHSLKAGGSVWCLILSAQQCPAGCQKKLWEWMADVTGRQMTGCLRPRAQEGARVLKRPGRLRWPCRTGILLHRSSQLWLHVETVLACFSLLLLL